MKKYVYSFIAMYMLGVVPGLATVSIPTQAYINDGLVEVYQRAKRLNTTTQTNINNLSNYVGTPSDSENPPTLSLTQQVENLASDLDDVISETTYDGVNGVSITDDRLVSVYGLSETTRRNNKFYVFKNNVATELEVADTWYVTPVNNDEP